MRVPSILLAVTATILVGSAHVLSATVTNQITTSALASPGQVESIQAVHDKRFLRLRTHTDEERTLDLSKLDDMMKLESARSTAFYKWWQLNITPTQVYNALDLDKVQTYRRIFNEYQAYVSRLS
ncbi:uncharacterized protein KRP23_11668 [Phytophthora ramorum]|uniref:uncharacterized protein n=1 Tax=Phytophthora ramorum TaxID=164328 RepID=UPI0030998079|nr:hypothetical protein KRP23_11668 [Phytophthora ramorum]